MPRDLKEYNKQYYIKNKENRKKEILVRQHFLRDVIRDFKLAHGCFFCGYSKCARALQFHHKNSSEKEHNIARMVTQGRSLTAIMKEIDKCLVVCANCHAELHEDTDA